MTAEIAIMNREAIALAADSAVTMGQKGEWEQKVFTSANKLFALSKYCPIGIMVYGRASFMGVPWETIIKIYRTKSGKQKLDTVKEYADDFIAFLNKDDSLFPEDQQKEYLYENTASYFALIKGEIERQVESIIDTEGEITDTQKDQITSDVIKRHYTRWRNAEMLPSIPKTHIENIIKKYSGIIDKAGQEVFQNLPISAASLNQLTKISGSLFSKDIFPADISGVVIAGFGEEEAFPSLESFSVEGMVDNKLKHKEQHRTEISPKTIASITPFARKEMVHAFMEGVDPDLQSYIEDDLSGIFDKYPEIIVESIERFDHTEKEALLRKLKRVSNSIVKDHRKRVTSYREDRFVDPIMTVVAALPKDEMAMMAETLVNLALFKQKVTLGSETVAGPVDVAIISKGDGFIWIKRKHYFEPELNPQFLARYYREEKNERKEERSKR